MVKGFNKGHSFERLIYKDLRKYGNCKRTIGSGSSDEPADIHFEQYICELKHLKKINWTILTKFWNKLNNNIGMNNSEPVIIFRQNREPIMVMCRIKYKNKTTRGIISYNIWKQIILKE